LMLLGYVIGPFRGEHAYAIRLNIRNAEALALQVWNRGCACVCPHMNTANFQGAAPDEVWLQGDLEILGRCDFAVTVKGWKGSTGSVQEVAFCQERGIPVFETLNKLDGWLKLGRIAAGG
jgi:hypothetical protein